MANDNSSDDRDLDADEPRSDVSALASAVLSVLSEKSDDTGQSIRSSIVQRLVQATLQDSAFNADLLVKDLGDERVAPDQIVDIYIPEAARDLGLMWVEDEIGFAKVTIATARLQGLLTLLAPPWSAKPTEDNRDLNTLLVLQSNDSHTLGPHVATAQLRRMGASVRVLFGPDGDTVLRILAEEPYDLLMFSCSRTDGLASIAQMVKRLRAGSSATPPIALGGLVLNLTDRVKEKSGVDLVTSDIRVALKLCDKKKNKNRSMAR